MNAYDQQATALRKEAAGPEKKTRGISGDISAVSGKIQSPPGWGCSGKILIFQQEKAVTVTTFSPCITVISANKGVD